METLGSLVGLLIILALFALVIAAVAVLVIAMVRGITGRGSRPSVEPVDGKPYPAPKVNPGEGSPW